MSALASLFALIIALTAGAFVPVQAGANAALGRALGHPLWAAFASLAISLAAAALLLAALRAPAPDLHAAARAPAWAWAGGLIGVFYVIVALSLAPRLGAAAFMATLVCGQMLASLALDHYALAGFTARPLSVARLCGAALIVTGVILMQRPSLLEPAARLS